MSFSQCSGIRRLFMLNVPFRLLPVRIIAGYLPESRTFYVYFFNRFFEAGPLFRLPCLYWLSGFAAGFPWKK